MVADASNHTILMFDREGNLLDQFGEPGTEPGQLNYPYDLAIAPDGTFFVLEYGNCRVSHFSAEGEFLGWWGKPGYFEGELNRPWGLTIFQDGAIAIADTENGRIHIIDEPRRHFRAPGGPAS